MLVTKNRIIIGFCEDGSIQCFEKGNQYWKPVLKHIRSNDKWGKVHTACFLVDPVTFLTWEDDSTVKLFDLRKFKEPVKIVDNLPIDNENSGMDIS